MTIFRNVVLAAAIAGVMAGIAMAAMQIFFTAPIIIAAEAYEGQEAHSHDHAAAPAAEAAAPAGHDHDDEAWGPADGAERTFYTVAANIVTAIGFGLLLVMASEFAGGIGSWREGIVWGFAGFAAFTLAPGLGLPPELPGMPAADLVARQLWWIATVAATAGGLALVAFGRAPLLALAGVVLIVAPHLIGAPQPASHETAVPADLHHSFVVATTVTNLVFWCVLGAAIGFVRPRFAAGLDGARESLA